MTLLIVLLSLFLTTSHELTFAQKTNSQLSDLNLKSHETLKHFKKKQKIKGLAFAVFNNNTIYYSECMGNSTYGFKINDETIFSIQSISKNMTAFAVMAAVQDGLLNLDTPIIEYLPSFTVNSCFEVSPEQKITLRMLLSHTAGFTHEAPIGNNFDWRPCNIQEHNHSIEKTWLKFPAGSNYSYSNLGFDLASEIIAQKTGINFDNYLKIKLFEPALMTKSTANDADVVMNQNKTEGTVFGVRKKHYFIPLPGSGAVYTSLNDIIKYTRLLMNFGETPGKILVNKENIYEMFSINTNNYGLGTYLNKSNEAWYVNHNGGGFGYSATLVFFPEYNIGSVFLSNKSCNTFDVCMNILNEYIDSLELEKDTGVTALFNTLNGSYLENKTEIDRKKDFYCKSDSIFKPEWEKHIGTYILTLKGLEFKWYARIARFFGFGVQKIKVFKEGQALKITGWPGDNTLKEHEENLFFTIENEVLDLRTDKPSFRNIMIIKK